MLAAPAIDLTLILPAAIVLLGAVAATVLGFHMPRRAVSVVGMVSLLAAFAANLLLWGRDASTFAGAYRADAFAVAVSAVLLLGGFLALVTSMDGDGHGRAPAPEFTALVLYAITGTMILAAAGDLITVLIGFEVMSLAVYVLSGFHNRDASEEAGMKYFLLGALSSAVLVYGIALLFGATGTFSLAGIKAAIAADGFNNAGIATAGALMVLAGFAFKVSWAPFHQWTPDVYEGAPTVVTQFMSVAIKTAAFAGLLRVFVIALGGLEAWVVPVQVLIALTMLAGNLAALRQRLLKRMLAYSSVGHAGYLGLAVLAQPAVGLPAATNYLLVYTLMTAGAFALLPALSRDEDGPTVASLAGLARRQPWLAVGLALLMLSLAGIPPLAGFFAKYVVLAAGAQAGYYGLVVLAALTSAMSLYYYLRPVALAFFAAPEAVEPRRTARGSRLVVAFASLGVVALGILPGVWYGTLGSIAASAASR